MRTDKHISLHYVPGTPESPWLMAIDSNQFPKPKKLYDKLKVPKYDNGEFVFKIQTPGIKFDAKTPINVWAADKNNPGDPTQFKWAFLDDGSLLLINPNKDKKPTDYEYQLNFEGGVVPLDPILQNGCCNSRLGSGSNMVLLDTAPIAYLLAAAAVLVLGGAWARRRSA